MFEGHCSTGQRVALQDESVAETPWVKKYVRARIAEADPQGEIRTHEGVVTRDFGKEMEVVNSHPMGTGFGQPPWPKYVTKRCQKEGATEIPVPRAKAKDVEDIRERLDTPV
jgi:hypothetical protein